MCERNSTHKESESYEFWPGLIFALINRFATYTCLKALLSQEIHPVTSADCPLCLRFSPLKCYSTPYAICGTDRLTRIRLYTMGCYPYKPEEDIRLPRNCKKHCRSLGLYVSACYMIGPCLDLYRRGRLSWGVS